eukprot:TRINITY_DN2908_c0_g1_i1.p1 TRINITY_DN2908_c0_g1~~TRINITY_DN2908_c0_g1_i1.p1  ORF type:complete len:488 (+),score=85.51 TRINITY_DN2908_c0_g1_i1:235-1698(+)
MAIFIVSRHGERADYAFDDPTKRWFEAVKVSLPSLSHCITELTDDAMLTERGVETSRRCASSLGTVHPRIDLILSSPALRCVQTAHAYGQFFNVPVGIEPALFEPICYLPRPPTTRWRTPQELRAAGLHINERYVPLASAQPSTSEVDRATQEYLRRTGRLLRHLSATHPGAVIMLVGHASSHFAIPLMLATPHLAESPVSDLIADPHNFFESVLGGERLNGVSLNGIIRCINTTATAAGSAAAYPGGALTAGPGAASGSAATAGPWLFDRQLGVAVLEGAAARAMVAPTGFISLSQPMHGAERYFGHLLAQCGSGSIVFTARGAETLRVVVNTAPVCSRGDVGQPSSPSGPEAEAPGPAVYCFVIGESQGFIRRSNRGGDVSLAHSNAPGTCLSSQWQAYWVSLDASRGAVAMGEGQPHRTTTLLVAQDPNYLSTVRHIGFANWTKPVEIKEVYVGPPPSGLPNGWLGAETRTAGTMTSMPQGAKR